jgi:hypothetical protein
MRCYGRYTIGLFNYSQYQPNYPTEGDPLLSTTTKSPMWYRYLEENTCAACPGNTYTTFFATVCEAKNAFHPFSCT